MSARDKKLLGEFRFYQHNGDDDLANTLGINDVSKWEWRGDGNARWLYLGTVESGDEWGRQAWSVDVEVVAMPAQFWQFTIRTSRERAVDEAADFTEREWVRVPQTIKFGTGSGGFGTYWPIAHAFARGMIGDIEVVEGEVPS